MVVRVLFFGMLRDRWPLGAEALELKSGATVQAVLEHYSKAAPELQAIWASLALAVNQGYASKETVLVDGDEVALLPPVSGGCCAQGG